MSLCRCIVVSFCRYVVLSLCHVVMSLCRYVVVSLCRYVVYMSLPSLKNRSAKRTCVSFDLLLFHSVGLLVLNVSIWELKFYK